jgi:hypothetical protein
VRPAGPSHGGGKMCPAPAAIPAASWGIAPRPKQFFGCRNAVTGLTRYHAGMNSSHLRRIRKRLLVSDTPSSDSAGALDLPNCASFEYTSEDPEHCVENIVDDHSVSRFTSTWTKWLR